MYLVNYEGLLMKARTEKEVRAWFNTNQINAAINWGDLRREGYAESLCQSWDISKRDGREYRDINDLSNFAFYGGVLVELGSVDEAFLADAHNCRKFAEWTDNGPKGDGYYCTECGQFITSNAFEVG